VFNDGEGNGSISNTGGPTAIAGDVELAE